MTVSPKGTILLSSLLFSDLQQIITLDILTQLVTLPRSVFQHFNLNYKWLWYHRIFLGGLEGHNAGWLRLSKLSCWYHISRWPFPVHCLSIYSSWKCWWRIYVSTFMYVLNPLCLINVFTDKMLVNMFRESKNTIVSRPLINHVLGTFLITLVKEKG